VALCGARAAERDAGEAAAAMARRFAQQHHARMRAARLEVGRHVGAPHFGRARARRRIALVMVLPGIEHAGAAGGAALQDRHEFIHRGSHAAIIA